MLQCADSKGQQLDAYCREKRIVAVSPNTLYAHLCVIAMGLRGMQIEENARRLANNLAGLKKQFGNFSEVFEKIGTHLKNAQQSYQEADKRLDKTQTALEGMLEPSDADEEIPAGTQEILPLPLSYLREVRQLSTFRCNYGLVRIAPGISRIETRIFPCCFPVSGKSATFSAPPLEIARAGFPPASSAISGARFRASSITRSCAPADSNRQRALLPRLQGRIIGLQQQRKKMIRATLAVPLLHETVTSAGPACKFFRWQHGHRFGRRCQHQRCLTIHLHHILVRIPAKSVPLQFEAIAQ